MEKRSLDTKISQEQIFVSKNFVASNSSRTTNKFDPEKSFIFEGVLMCICLRGSAIVRRNYKEFAISGRQVLVILPNQIVCMADRTPDFFCETLFYPPDFMSSYPSPLSIDILLRINENPVITIPEEMMGDLQEMHAMIVKHHDNVKNPFRDDIVKALLYALMLEIGSVYVQERPVRLVSVKNRREEITEKFFKLLLKHFRQQRSVAFYADKLCLTPKYFSTVVKNMSGRYALEWINEVVVIEIKNRLRTTNHTALQISEEFNFPNPSFFSRFFKQYTGMTPLQYRDAN